MNSHHTLRVGFDGHAFSSPAAGIRRYSTELVRALLSLGEPIEIVALGGEAEAIPAGVERVSGVGASADSNAGWTLIGLPRTAARARVDLIHAPAYTAPFWAGVPVVLTIHDVSYESHPEWYPYRRDWLRRYFYRRSANGRGARADRVGVLGVGDLRRRTASRAIANHGHAARCACDFRAGRSESAARPAGNVTEPFLLHVGDLHERRNLPMLVDAMLAARRHFGAAAAIRSCWPASIAASATGCARWQRRRARRTRWSAWRRSSEDRAARAVPRRDGARVSVAVRRIRFAADRSDGQRHAGAGLARVDSSHQ